MTKITPKTIQFLSDLKHNNQRNWFKEHKQDYNIARNNFEEFADFLLENIQSFDDSLQNVSIKQCMFRIYRDIRFSPNKEPYKTHFGIYFAKKGGKSSDLAGYYFHLDSEESFFGGGIYMPPPEYLKKIRKEIYYQIDEFKEILDNPDFKKYYPEGIEEIEKLKRAPIGFPTEFPEMELLKNKHFFTSHYFDPQDTLNDYFMDFISSGFQAVKPLVDFINFTIDQ